jgi:hypothetical protein
MKTNNQPTQWAIADGVNLFVLNNATSLEGAINIYVKRILRDEYDIKPDAEGKLLTKANLQAAYEDWADTMIENMENDGYEPGKYVIDMDGMIDNWSNRYWVAELYLGATTWEAINNQFQYELIRDIFIRKGIEEKEYEIKATA